MRLAFVRFEPYVIPKMALTGDSTERTDTRVMQAIYRVETAPELARVFVGQQMDVFIDCKRRSRQGSFRDKLGASLGAATSESAVFRAERRVARRYSATQKSPLQVALSTPSCSGPERRWR